MPELTLTSPDVHSRVDSNTLTLGKPMPESTLTLCQSRLYPPVRDFRFGLSGSVDISLEDDVTVFLLLRFSFTTLWFGGMGGPMGTSQTVIQKCFHFTLGNQVSDF